MESVYRCAENASVDALICTKWAHDLIPRARERVADEEWIVLF